MLTDGSGPTTNNQVQLATVLAAHYAATRNAVEGWLQRRDQYIVLYITAVAAILGLFISRNDDSVLLLIPFLSILAISGYASADIHVGYLCLWLKREYTDMLDKYVDYYGILTLTPWHWDNSATLDRFYKSGTGLIRYAFLALLFALGNLAGPIYIFCKQPNLQPASLIPSVVAVVLTGIVLAVLYRKRKAMAR